MERDIVRTCRHGTLKMASFLSDGEAPDPQEWEEIAKVGKAPADTTISLADMTKLYLYWRDATVSVLDEEAARLGIDDATAEVARVLARAGSDASLIRTAKRFDDERAELQARLADDRARLAHLARHDALTGLPNRQMLLDRLSELLERSGWSTTGSAVLFVDLDEFKAVNDVGGHAAGDRVLRDVAARLSSAVRPGDTVARFGGDEFVLLCSGLADPAVDAAAIADRIQALLAEPVVVDGRPHMTSASIGVAVVRPGHDPERLLQEADAAMYTSKQRGPAGHEVYAGR
jgi:diguanylate cyclase (GGDEF)-like protein